MEIRGFPSPSCTWTTKTKRAVVFTDLCWSAVSQVYINQSITIQRQLTFKGLVNSQQTQLFLSFKIPFQDISFRASFGKYLFQRYSPYFLLN